MGFNCQTFESGTGQFLYAEAKGKYNLFFCTIFRCAHEPKPYGTGSIYFSGYHGQNIDLSSLNFTDNWAGDYNNGEYWWGQLSFYFCSFIRGNSSSNSMYFYNSSCKINCSNFINQSSANDFFFCSLSSVNLFGAYFNGIKSTNLVDNKSSLNFDECFFYNCTFENTTGVTIGWSENTYSIDPNSIYEAVFIESVFNNINLFCSSNLFSKSSEIHSSIIFSQTSLILPSILFSQSSTVLFSESPLFSHSSEYLSSLKFTESSLFFKSNSFSQSHLFIQTYFFSESSNFSLGNLTEKQYDPTTVITIIGITFVFLSVIIAIIKNFDKIRKLFTKEESSSNIQTQTFEQESEIKTIKTYNESEKENDN